VSAKDAGSRRRLFADTTPLRTPDFRRLLLAGIITVIGGGPRLADVVHGTAAAAVGATIAATGGGVLVVVGVVLAALAAPAFLRYRPGLAR